MDLVSLESIFKEIWEHDSSLKAKGKAYLSPFQKWTFWLMFIFFGLALLLALSTTIQLYDWQKPFALFLALLTQVTGVLYQLSFVYEGIKIFKAPARHFLEPLTKFSAKDYKLAESFSRFSETQLFYAKERLSLESSHMKARVGMLVGAVEKVGIVPILVTWLFASYKYIAGGEVMFEQVDWLVYGLLALYLIMLPILFFVHKLERYQLLIITALEIKAKKSSQQDAQKTRTSV